MFQNTDLALGQCMNELEYPTGKLSREEFIAAIRMTDRMIDFICYLADQAGYTPEEFIDNASGFSGSFVEDCWQHYEENKVCDSDDME
jgi:hypothetical protein